MKKATHRKRPARTGFRSRSLEASGSEEMLEGMKVLFDERVGLYPVSLVAEGDAESMSRKAGRRAP